MTESPSAMLTSCPKCGHFVRMPAVVSLAANLRCPMCRHEFPLRSVLPDTIPELELVGLSENQSSSSLASSAGESLASSGERSIPVADRLSIPEILQRGLRRRRHRRHHDERPVNVAETSQSRGESPADARSDPRRVVRRSRRYWSSHSSLEIVKVIVGAFLALPVAQLIIWWGLGLDPFRLGPAAARVIPFVVPSRLAEDKPSP